MAAVYPGAVRVFTRKINNIDIVDATDPNTLQEEVVALQTVLGTNPQVSSGLSGTYLSVATTFASVDERLDNIERGITGDTHTQYVKRTGGSAIVNTSSSSIGLLIQGASGQTANLQEWKNSSGTLVASVNPAGNLLAGSVIGASSTFTASSSSTVGVTVTGVSGQTANLQEWKNSSGTVVAAIAPDGSLLESGSVVEHDNIYVLTWVFG